MDSRKFALKGSRAARTSMVGDAYVPPAKMETCDKCGFSTHKYFDRHVRVCSRLPTAQEFTERFNSNPSVSVNSLANEYGTSTDKIKNIMIHADIGWTNEILKERGYMAKVYNDKNKMKKTGKKWNKVDATSPRCECGILVKRQGKLCKWCILESHGIKSYHDLHGE